MNHIAWGLTFDDPVSILVDDHDRSLDGRILARFLIFYLDVTKQSLKI